MSNKTRLFWAAQAMVAWHSLVYDDRLNIDPENELDWHSLALGFFMGRGYSKPEALQLVAQVDKRGWL